MVNMVALIERLLGVLYTNVLTVQIIGKRLPVGQSPWGEWRG
jgi:hypothetical protein